VEVLAYVDILFTNTSKQQCKGVRSLADSLVFDYKIKQNKHTNEITQTHAKKNTKNTQQPMFKIQTQTWVQAVSIRALKHDFTHMYIGSHINLNGL